MDIKIARGSNTRFASPFGAVSSSMLENHVRGTLWDVLRFVRSSNAIDVYIDALRGPDYRDEVA